MILEPQKTEKKYSSSGRVYMALLQALQSGKWSKGEKMPAERRLAEDFACSRVSVRAALKRLAEQKIVERVSGVGTFVAGGPMTRHWRQLGLVFPAKDIQEVGYYDKELMIGFLMSCERFGFSANLVMQKKGELLKDTIARLELKLSDYDALIFSAQLVPEDKALLDAVHCCYVSLMAGKNNDVSYVDINNFHGGYLAAKHLLDSGCRHPVFLGPSEEMPYAQPRMLGVQKAFQEHHLEFLPQKMSFPGITDERRAAELTAQLVADQSYPVDAFVVTNDWAMFGVIGELRRRKLRIPEDVALIMYDDYQWVSRAADLQMTGIRQPFYEQIAIAVRSMDERLSGRRNDRMWVHVLQPELIVRASSPITKKGISPENI